MQLQLVGLPDVKNIKHMVVNKIELKFKESYTMPACQI
jgi:hypothetical protein